MHLDPCLLPRAPNYAQKHRLGARGARISTVSPQNLNQHPKDQHMRLKHSPGESGASSRGQEARIGAQCGPAVTQPALSDLDKTHMSVLNPRHKATPAAQPGFETAKAPIPTTARPRLCPLPAPDSCEHAQRSDKTGEASRGEPGAFRNALAATASSGVSNLTRPCSQILSATDIRR